MIATCLHGRRWRTNLAKKSSSDQEDKQLLPDLINEEDSSISSDSKCEDTVLNDLLGRDDNFQTPRRLLAQSFPIPVDCSLAKYNILSTSDSIISEPLGVSRLPPLSVVEEAQKTLREQKAQFVEFQDYGTFHQKACLCLKDFTG